MVEAFLFSGFGRKWNRTGGSQDLSGTNFERRAAAARSVAGRDVRYKSMQIKTYITAS